jgi:hypothetical protein
MTEHTNEELEDAIRRVGTPVSDRHREMALGAFAWRDIDAELATLSEEALLVRSAGTATHVYRLGDVEIDIEVSDEAGDTRRVAAVVDGVDVTSALLHDVEGAPVRASVVAGVATWTGVSARLVRIEIQTAERTGIITEWFAI